MRNNSTLQNLDLEGNGIRDEGAKALAEGLIVHSTLQTFNLSSNQIGDEGATAIAEALKNNANLLTLDLCQNRIRKDGATAIAEALTSTSQGLWKFLSNDKFKVDRETDTVKEFSVNSTLQELNLDFNSIGDEGASALAEALEFSSTLQILSLASTDIPIR